MLLHGSSNDRNKADKAMKPRLKGRGVMLAATALLALAFLSSTGDAFAGRPLKGIQKGVNAIDNIVKGIGKGTRGAVDDVVEGAVRGADDAAEGLARGADDIGQAGIRGIDDAAAGVARGADDALQGLAKGADDLGTAGRALPPVADDVAGAPKYLDAPKLDDAGQALRYDVVPDEALDDLGAAADLPEPPRGVAGYIQPDAPAFADDIGDAADALPGGYIQPGAPLGAPAKPAKPAKGKLPKLGNGNTPVAKITALADDAADLADDAGTALKPLSFVVEDADNFVLPARVVAKAKSGGRIKKIVAGTVVGVVVTGVGTTAILYHTVEPVRDDIDAFLGKTKEVVGDTLAKAGDVVNGPKYQLSVTNASDIGRVDIFKLDENENEVFIESITEVPKTTTVQVKEGDVIVLKLDDVEWERFKIVDMKTERFVQ
jgi:hypothetical protein